VGTLKYADHHHRFAFTEQSLQCQHFVLIFIHMGKTGTESLQSREYLLEIEEPATTRVYYYNYRYNLNIIRASIVSRFIFSRFALPSVGFALLFLLFASPDNSVKVFSYIASFPKSISLNLSTLSLFSSSL
jgi:hypothetical protein